MPVFRNHNWRATCALGVLALVGSVGEADAQTWMGRVFPKMGVDYRITLGRGITDLRVDFEDDLGFRVVVNTLKLQPETLIQMEPLPNQPTPTYHLNVEVDSQDYFVRIRGGSRGGRYRLVISSLANVWVEEEAASAIASGSTRNDRAGYATMTVFYATDRQRVQASPLHYGPDRSPDGVIYRGRLQVTLPHYKEMSALAKAMAWALGREVPEAAVQKATELNERAFREALAVPLQDSDPGDLLLFVHGFNVAFEDSVIRTAQLAYDLGFKGKPIAYSWPSEGRVENYTVDANNCALTVDHLVGFLDELLAIKGAKRIHLIAHSMGSFALLGALNQLASKNPSASRLFTHIVLTAPDVDADRFKQMQKAVKARGTTMTIYVSSKDWALYASKKAYNKYPRLGDAKPSPVVVDGIDTIDASGVETDFVGHSYYMGEKSIVGDLFYLIHQDLRATARNLGKGGQPPVTYFVYPK